MTQREKIHTQDPCRTALDQVHCCPVKGKRDSIDSPLRVFRFFSVITGLPRSGETRQSKCTTPFPLQTWMIGSSPGHDGVVDQRNTRLTGQQWTKSDHDDVKQNRMQRHRYKRGSSLTQSV
jgi:hypothetical protein